MLTAADLHGIIPPLLTPLNPDETVDVPSLQRLTRYVIDGGCHALFVLGSSGEFCTLPEEQHRRVLETVVAAAEGRVPILAGIAASSLTQALRNAELARHCGADACVATTPYYFVYSQAELQAYFTRLADEIALPLVMYNIPQRTGNPLRPATVLALSEHPNIIGLKDTSEDLMAITRMITSLRGRGDFSFLVGTETLLVPAMLLGAQGAVLGFANLAPHFSVRMYEVARSQDVAAARLIQDQAEDLFRVFRHYSYGEPSIGAGLGGLKLSVSLLGLCDARMCFPARVPEDAASMRELVEGWIAAGIIQPPV
jgi:4-hydroxy-tetrahydrodipicolinate synthase